MPAKRRGAAAAGYLRTARQALASDPTAAPHQHRLRTGVGTPRDPRQPGPCPHALLAIVGSAAVQQSEWEPCPLPHFVTGARTREQVRAQRSPLSPPRQRPSPGLTGGRDERAQLVQDTCPHPVSRGPTGLPRGTHRAVARAQAARALEGGSEVTSSETPGKA